MTESSARPLRSRLRRAVMAVVALVGVAVAYLGVNLWLVHRTGSSDQARSVDAIVVLGAAQYDGRPSPQLAARLDQVLLLWQRGLAPMVVTTGGNRPGDRFTEAQASADYLTARGVPADAIQQVGGTNTFDSLAAAAQLLQRAGARRVLLVTDPFHSLRARLISQEVGLTAYVSPTRTSPVQGATAFWREVKEAVGVSVGRVIGFERLLRITG